MSVQPEHLFLSQHNYGTPIWFQKKSRSAIFGSIRRTQLMMAAATATATGASSSSSSAALPPKKYDVFISFRGEDTRSNFTSHLHAELCRKKIQTYIDDRLEKGDGIAPSLIKAIEESHVAVVIFSENYAFSKWCLDELLKITESKEKGLIAIPVFYKIDPSLVRRQTGNYSKAFAKHERDFKINKEKIQKWKGALMEAANLSGWHSQNYRTEYELVENIVKNIMQKLNRMYSNDLRKLVGIEQNYACIESILKIGSRNVRIIGIWGMGGIGKTTVAAVAFAKLSSLYEASCFLANVREEAKNRGLNYLRNKLLSELLEDDDLHISTPLVGTSFLMSRLSRKTVFIVLDDVSTSEQLEYLIGGADCLGPASRVIITTRDKQVLSRGVDEIHEVKKLDFQESLQLFSMNAFNKSHPELGYEELSKKAVDYAQGVPLALKVLGSFLCSKSIEIWKSALEKLKKYPNVDIQNVLRLSYNGLDDEEKEIFLDIAFFFRGERKEHVIRILDACGFHTTIGIERLLNKALITITFEDDIEMHDLIQEMGKEIVRQESSKNPGRRSRLWDPEEVYDIFKNNKVTDTVEGIILNMSQIKSDVYLSPDTLTKMSNLRLLKFFYILGAERHNNVHLPTSLDFLPNSIRYLFWEGYPSKSLPSTFCPLNLVQISMQNSKVEKLWDGVQDLVHLNKIDFRYSEHLMELPDFSTASNLEYVYLDGCTSLCQVHSSILSLQKLVELSLMNCKQLKSPESIIHSRCLKCLKLKGCSSLNELSVMSEDMKILHLDNTAIVELPSSIGSLNKLQELTIRECFHLKNLPNELCGLTSLESLDLSDCRQVDTSKLAILLNGLRSLTYLNLTNCCNLYQVPDNINLLSQLRMLDLSGSNVETLPASIIHLSQLQYLWLFDCRRLQFVPELPPFIEELNVRNCISLETVLFTNSSSASAAAFDQGKLSIWLENCVKLDEHSVNTMLKRMKEGAIDRIVYPESKVPNWFSYQTTTQASITIEPQCPSNSNLLCSAVFCLVVSLVSSPEKNSILDIECKYHVADGIEVRRTSFYGYGYHQTINLKRAAFGMLDHVFIWYDDLPLSDQSKVSFEFFVEPGDKMEEVSISIKGCGVQPIYDKDLEDSAIGMRVGSSTTASSADTKNEKELEALVIPPIQKSMFPTLSTATNWKNQSKGLLDILPL